MGARSDLSTDSSDSAESLDSSTATEVDAPRSPSAQAACDLTNGSSSDSAARSTSTSEAIPKLPSLQARNPTIAHSVVLATSRERWRPSHAKRIVSLMILPATRFSFERDMLAPLADALPSLLELGDDLQVRILREPTIGLVIPDLLIGVWRCDRSPRAYASATWVDAHFRALVERECVITTDEVRARLHLSLHAAAASEARLARHGVLLRCAGTAAIEGETIAWTLAPGSETSGVEIVAIEAKLSRWHDAVAQAASYLSFAHRSYVALDGNRVRVTTEMLAAVKAAKVGLMLQHGRILRIAVQAPLQLTPCTPERVIAMTKLVTERGGRAFRSAAGQVWMGPKRELAATPAG